MDKLVNTNFDGRFFELDTNQQGSGYAFGRFKMSDVAKAKLTKTLGSNLKSYSDIVVRLGNNKNLQDAAGFTSLLSSDDWSFAPWLLYALSGDFKWSMNGEFISFFVPCSSLRVSDNTARSQFVRLFGSTFELNKQKAWADRINIDQINRAIFLDMLDTGLQGHFDHTMSQFLSNLSHYYGRVRNG